MTEMGQIIPFTGSPSNLWEKEMKLVKSVPTLQISNSEIQTWKDCRRRWWLQYFRGLKAPEKTTGALALGTNIHSSLASYYSPSGSKGLALGVLTSIYEEVRKNTPNDLTAVDKDHKMARTMLEGYFDWIEETGIDSDFEIIEAESEIEHTLHISGTDVTILGKRDAIGIDKLERFFFLDHKSCQSLIDPLLDLNEQLFTYALLYRLNNPDKMPSYAMWNLLRKTLRTAKATPPFYARESVEVSDKMLRNFYIRLTGTISDIIQARDELNRNTDHRAVCYPRPSSRCSWGCDFRTACPMFDMDDYAEEFLTNNFRVSNPYERYAESRSDLDSI